MPDLSFILVHNANVNQQNNRQESPLHFATRSGNLETIQLLVTLKGNLTLKGSIFFSPSLTFSLNK
jgi:ankyrin repeat protein